MTITQNDVEYIAELARLELTTAEIEALATELNQILAYFETLDAVDVTAIPPTASVLALTSVLRDDVVRPSLDREVLLGGAAQSDAGCFEVPAVLDDGGSG